MRRGQEVCVACGAEAASGVFWSFGGQKWCESCFARESERALFGSTRIASQVRALRLQRLGGRLATMREAEHG